jgi:glycosidase
MKFGGIKFFLDILPNHTAFDSAWLNEPEHAKSVYNEQTAPHLAVAIELDKAIK